MKKMKSILTSAFLFSILLGLASCDDSFIYEKEGDCSVKVQFVFKKHRQALHSIPGREADVFYSTVETVHLFVYDEKTGELVFEKTENTDNLKSPADLKLGTSSDRCILPVDLPAGKYRMVAWCGLDETDENNAFLLGGNESRSQYSHCRIKLSEDTGNPVHDEKYDALYHGVTRDVEITDRETGDKVVTIELTKNTNEISVWVQHATQTFSEGDYEVVYTDANGTMHFEDNSMLQDDRLEYNAHTTSLLTSSTEYNGSMMETGALVAHISTARLMQGNRKDTRLEVRDREGNTVFSIPFIDYVLQLQTLTNDEQYYLDCEDTYNCSFYLTGDTQVNGKWMPSMIIINNWVVVPDQMVGM